jgi:hypothetical protein
MYTTLQHPTLPEVKNNCMCFFLSLLFFFFFLLFIYLCFRCILNVRCGCCWQYANTNVIERHWKPHNSRSENNVKSIYCVLLCTKIKKYSERISYSSRQYLRLKCVILQPGIGRMDMQFFLLIWWYTCWTTKLQLKIYY